jgi:integrase
LDERSNKLAPIDPQNYVNWTFLPALKAAKIEAFTWHCLRHTFASRLVMASVDLRTVQEADGTQDAGDDAALLAPVASASTRRRAAAEPRANCHHYCHRVERGQNGCCGWRGSR